MTLSRASFTRCLFNEEPVGLVTALLPFIILWGCATPVGQAPPLVPVEIAAGERHTCAVTAVGDVRCWGSNHDGQLGDGTDMDRTSPVAVKGLTGKVSAITAGARHTCALISDGSVFCWGENHDGQLGDGTTQDRSVPAQVASLPTAASGIAAGERHTCALIGNGRIWCWGNNHYGQLGDGTTTDLSRPVQAEALPSEAVTMAAGRRHTCALTKAKSLHCWGSNRDGELGDGTTTDRSTPVQVVGLPAGASAVTAGRRHSCALTDAGGVWCWGKNQRGQLGNGTRIGSRTPVEVTGLTGGVKALSAGWRHTCAITATGSVKCWGDNHDGQLGDGTGDRRTVPVDAVNVLGNVHAIAAGGHHTCALLGQSVRCWGENEDGQLGDGTTSDSLYVKPEVGT